MASIRLRYQTVEFPAFDIHLCTLRDHQEFDDPDGRASALGISSSQWSHFGVIWPGGWALANEMITMAGEGRSFLELGCGIGLASLVLNHRGINVTAMDYHPEAGGFLARNTRLNNDPDIPFVRADWTAANPAIPCFDVILASDVLYEDEHAQGVARFIKRHLAENGLAVVADPGRGHRGAFQRAMASEGFDYRLKTPGNYQIMEFSAKAP